VTCGDLSIEKDPPASVTEHCRRDVIVEKKDFLSWDAFVCGWFLVRSVSGTQSSILIATGMMIKQSKSGAHGELIAMR
jgi:hypothetical protein